MTEFYRQYLAVAVFVLAAFLMVGAMLGMARLLRPTVPQEQKNITYESGSDPLPLFGQMNVRYYVYALLFVIFDVEAASFYPWAVQMHQLRGFGLLEMVSFVIVLLIYLVLGTATLFVLRAMSRQGAGGTAEDAREDVPYGPSQ